MKPVEIWPERYAQGTLRAFLAAPRTSTGCSRQSKALEFKAPSSPIYSRTTGTTAAVIVTRKLCERAISKVGCCRRQKPTRCALTASITSGIPEGRCQRDASFSATPVNTLILSPAFLRISRLPCRCADKPALAEHPAGRRRRWAAVGRDMPGTRSSSCLPDGRKACTVPDYVVSMRICWQAEETGLRCTISPIAQFACFQTSIRRAAPFGARPEGELHAYFNLTANGPLPDAASEGGVLLFSSESMRYRGGRETGASLQQLRPYECIAFGCLANYNGKNEELSITPVPGPVHGAWSSCSRRSARLSPAEQRQFQLLLATRQAANGSPGPGRSSVGRSCLCLFAGRGNAACEGSSPAARPRRTDAARIGRLPIPSSRGPAD